MRNLKVAAGLTAAICTMALSAAPALAVHVWEKKVGGTWSEITTATEAVTEGNLQLEDSKSTLGAVRVECKIKSTGKIGPGKADSVEKAEATGCKVVKGTCGSPTAKAIHLPWTTELTESEGKVRDLIKNSGKGLPGYEVTCTVLIKVTDTCEGETSAATTNNLTEGIVEETFDAKSPKAKCSVSKENTGSLEGTLKVKAPAGAEAVRVS